MNGAGFDTDVCVIGAGAAGLTVAAGAVQMGARVTLIERGEMGGDCLNTGCVPSKALLAAARRAEAMRQAGAFGLRPADPAPDFAAVMAHVREVIAAIAPQDSEARFRGLGVEVIRAAARFVAPDAVEAGGRRIRARRFVIATGSRPAVPPVPGLAALPFLTTDTVWGLAALPARLLVLGGGAVGLELAQAFRRLGAGVTVLEAARALGREDPDAAAPVLARLRAEGVAVHEGVRVVRAEAEAGGPVLVAEDGARHAGSHLLVATGRAPDLEGLGLEAAGVRADARGVRSDGGLRTANPRIFVAGDAAGGPLLTHVAGWQAGLVLRRMLFRLPVRADASALPRVTFTDPELAQAGLTEAEAWRRHGPGLAVLRVPFAEIDRARAERAAEGFAKLMVARGRPVGCTMVGEGAGEAIQPVALAIQARLRIGALAAMVAPYPTLGEIGRRAAGAFFAPRLFGNPRVAGLVRLLLRL